MASRRRRPLTALSNQSIAFPNMRIGRTAAWVEHGKDAPYHDLTTFPVEKKREKISFCRGIKTIGLLMDGRLILGRSDRNSGPGQSERVQCLLICPPCSYQPRHVLANPRRRGVISTSLVISPSTLHCSSPRLQNAWPSFPAAQDELESSSPRCETPIHREEIRDRR
jgi:hypothetical protein